jgi:hypothetical protein
MTRKRGQIVITWNASARAVDYRIKIQLGVARPELLATARHSLTLKPRDKKIAVAISVTPQGADGSLGRGASAHLNRARR